MATTDPATSVSEPVLIFKLAHRFLLYDANVIAYVREKYNIGGVLIGGLPQAPQQNVFLGVPLELMPEEARLLVEKGVAVIQDDVKAHKNGYLAAGLSAEEKKAYQATLSRQGQAAATQASKKTDDRKKAALSKIAASGDWNDIPEDMLAPPSGSSSRSSSRMGKKKARAEPKTPRPVEEDSSELLFSGPPQPAPTPSTAPSVASIPAPQPFLVTPATSYPPLRPPSATPSRSSSTTPALSESGEALPETPSSYPLFKHLHSKGYFMSPGLRFGCQYMAYPGDPLRFHSHFLCKGMEWDQEFDLLEIVGGGRLGTGVKKGYLVGGQDTTSSETSTDKSREVRTFCVEWGGM